MTCLRTLQGALLAACGSTCSRGDAFALEVMLAGGSWAPPARIVGACAPEQLLKPVPSEPRSQGKGQARRPAKSSPYRLLGDKPSSSAQHSRKQQKHRLNNRSRLEFLAVWQLGLCCLTAGGAGSIPGRKLRYRPAQAVTLPVTYH